MRGIANCFLGFRFLVLVCLSLFCCGPLIAKAATNVRGIYITQSTMVDTEYLSYLVKRAKATGINTFVVDMDAPSKRYRTNLSLLKNNGIRYVARVVIFPGGGTPERISSIPYREKKLTLIKTAVAYGADAIQLDYIRYNTARKASSQHAIDVNNVIAWFKERLKPHNIPLEVDVFGITSFGEEKHIGQNVVTIAQNADVICPMNYPSHFQPFAFHSARPYETVFNALNAMHEQFEKNNKKPAKIIAWIETSNYHYAFSSATKQKYIRSQIRAVNDAKVSGWYAWSAGNQYDNLFRTLESWSKNTTESDDLPLDSKLDELSSFFCPIEGLYPTSFTT